MNLSEKFITCFLEGKMRSSKGVTFEIPSGKWKHKEVSYEWEKYNTNDDKGRVGSFKRDHTNKQLLNWSSDKSDRFIDVSDIKLNGDSLYLKDRGGLELWFTKA